MAPQNHRLPPGSKDSSALGAGTQTALEKELKLLIIQDHLKSGGAARAAGRWRELLAENGYAVFQVAGDEIPPGGERLTGKPARGWGRVREIFSRRDRSRKAAVEKQLEQLLSKHQPDLIWMHNLAGGGKWGWSEQMVTLARRHVPVIWTLHDMWALGNGDESYWEADSGLDSRNLKGAWREKIQTGRGRGARVESWMDSRVQNICGFSGQYPVLLTAPSQWLAELTGKTTGQGCVFLPNPIDLQRFSPGDRKSARKRLGLPQDGLVVLAGADSLADPRKGFDLLREAWEPACVHGAILALFGRNGRRQPGERYLGNLSSDEEMVAAFQAADLYVHPARLENAACTIQEAMACGTPVMAFKVGGNPEMIRFKKTGFLASELNLHSLRQTLESALADREQLSRMRAWCRSAAEEYWNPQVLVAKFGGMADHMSAGLQRQLSGRNCAEGSI